MSIPKLIKKYRVGHFIAELIIKAQGKSTSLQFDLQPEIFNTPNSKVWIEADKTYRVVITITDKEEL